MDRLDGGDRGTCPQRSVTPLAVSQLAGTRPRSPADVMLECLTTPHHTREAYPTASATNSSTTTMIPSFEGASLTLGLGCAVNRLEQPELSDQLLESIFYVVFTVGRSKSGRHAADDLWLVLS
jgi:hypothetical protein